MGGGDGEEMVTVQTQCGRPLLPQRARLHRWVTWTGGRPGGDKEKAGGELGLWRCL